MKTEKINKCYEKLQRVGSRTIAYKTDVIYNYRPFQDGTPFVLLTAFVFDADFCVVCTLY